MGLCKCPRKKVTNLFCFEHRVNVCEHCLVQNHSTCVVQSYLAWLQDSDYDPNCSLCGESLSEPSLDCVRLVCYHIYHWDCLERWARSLPARTAPAGFRCPTCQEPLFPKPQHVSPVVDALKARLQGSNWARAGLGLSLLPEVESAAAPSVHSQSATPTPPPSTALPLGEPHFDDDFTAATARKPTYGGGADGGSVEYRIGDETATLPKDEDLAENKYKRRSAFDWLRRFIRSRAVDRSVDPLRGYKRLFFALLLLVIVGVGLITIMTAVSKSRSEMDPFLDPIGNPNIRVAVADHKPIPP